MKLRVVQASEIIPIVSELCIKANEQLPEDLCETMRMAIENETYPPAKEFLDVLRENARIAALEHVPACQDTGMTVVYAEVGQNVHIEGNFEEAVQEGIRQGYVNGYLRKSVVRDPFDRVNTGDNTPGILHVRLVPGDKIRLTVAPKGAGSENMSRMTMLTPAQGLEGAFQFVMETVRKAGANPCPPMILGIGIGGNFETAPLLAKTALLDPLNVRNPDPFYADLELEWLNQINATGIGPQGLGGKTTCLSVHIRAMATHIACLPVAVSVGCHVNRHSSVEV